ncbi:MAG: LapA family protein [Burkholderiales bacterium]|nr:LapA family protein [Burkholderiales bacterium]
MSILRVLSTVLWVVVFLLLLLLALKNADPVTVNFYFGQAWQGPLILVVLAAFALGALSGLAACVPAFIRRRREIAGLKKELRLRPAGPAEREQPAAPGDVAPPPL